MTRRKSSRWLHYAADPGSPAKSGRGWLAGAALALAASGGVSCAPAAPSVVGSQSVAYTGAAITAVAAGVLWAVGGGCKLQGCPYGSYCNQKTGFCDVRKCSEGCPDFTVCNEGLGRCQAPPPANPPTDFLPEDNLLQRPLK